MITQNRWLHILGVARKCKEYAIKFRHNDSKFAEDMFLLGIMHDIGYEFIEDNMNHAAIGGEILKRNNYTHWQEVSLHGNENIERMSDELFILNCADLSTGPNGEDFTFDERLAEIASRFGYKTPVYNKCLAEIEKLKTDKRYHKIY